MILKTLAKMEEWNVLVLFLGEYIEKLNEKEIVGTNAFEELRSLHKRQGGVEELKNFFDIIERQAFE